MTEKERERLVLLHGYLLGVHAACGEPGLKTAIWSAADSLEKILEEISAHE